jgi:FMN reductase
MKIVGVLGSPSAESRSPSLLEHVRQRLQLLSGGVHVIAVRDLPAAPLLLAEVAHPAIRHASTLVADVVIVATPIYKAA